MVRASHGERRLPIHEGLPIHLQKGTAYHHQRNFKLFPATSPLEFLAIDIAVSLQKSAEAPRFVVFTTILYSKLTKAIPTAKLTALHVSLTLPHHWAIQYDIPDYLLSDNEAQFKSKLFSSMCTFFAVSKGIIKGYHPQSNGQARRFNRMLITRFQFHIAQHQNGLRPLCGAAYVLIHYLEA